MNITYIITGLGMGGAERQLCDLIDQLAIESHNILLVSLNGATINRPKNNNVKLVELHMKKTPWGFIIGMMKLRKILVNFKPDVIHSHMFHSNIFARLLRLTFNVPVLICSAHNTNEGGWIRMLIYRLTDKLADITTNVSKEAVDSFIEKKAVTLNKIIYMPNGIDVDKFVYSEALRNQYRNILHISSNTTLLMAVGRLTLAKDYVNLLTAISIIKNQNILLVIIGVGEELDNLQNISEQLNIKDKVIFLGLQSNINEWLCAADLYVMSSAWEGLPLVICEAMSCELVVVSTDCGGVKELIDVGNTGFLVPIKNSRALADMLDTTISMKEEEKKRIGKKARDYIKNNYSLLIIADKWLELYNKLTKKK